MTTDKHIDAPAHTLGRLHIRVWDRLSGEQNAMSKSDLIDVTVQLHHETDRAVLVSDDGDRDLLAAVVAEARRADVFGEGV